MTALLVAAAINAQTGEQYDTGWSVARPNSGPSATAATDARIRILLNHVLKQSDGVAFKVITKHSAESTPPVVSRTSRGNGWRPVGRLAGPMADPNAERGDIVVHNADEFSDTANDAQRSAPSDAAEHADLEFRAPTIAESGPNKSSALDAATSARRPNQLPPDELSPELLPGGIWLRRGTAIEPTVQKRPHIDDSVDDELTETTEPVISDQSDSFGAEPTIDQPKVAMQPDAGDERTTDQDPSAPPVGNVNVAPAPLTPQLKNLRNRLRSVLKGYYQKPLNSQENDPWEVMHGMLSYGVHSQIRQNGPRGESITAIGWLCYNRPCKGKSLLYVTPEGELRAKQGVGLQGHMGQLLAMLAQCHVSPEYPIRVGATEFTVQDLIEAEKKTCYPKSELTFKLIAFSHYLDLDTTWVNDQGLDWDFSRLISEELAQPIRGAACGGTHRLSGLSLVVKARQKSGAPLDGEYARAAEFVKNYQNYAYRMQNRDGSLSTKWFQGSGDEADIDRRVKTTGHILEWLIYSLSDEQLREPRTVRAVTYLTNLLYSNYDHEWEVGPRSHALHGLLLYDERVFRPFDPEGQTVIASPAQPATGSQRSSNRR